jgi:hypothetical protein
LAISSTAALRMAFSVSAPTDPRVRDMLLPLTPGRSTCACEGIYHISGNKQAFVFK